MHPAGPKRLPLIVAAAFVAAGCATTRVATAPPVSAIQGVTPPPIGPSPEDMVLGRGLFQRGVQHFHARRWWAALDAFRCSQRFVDHPLTSFNVARVLLALGRHVDVLEELEHFSQIYNVSVDDTWRREAEVIREAANAHVARLSVRVSPSGAVVAIDGADRGTVAGLREFTVQAGRHVVEVRAPEHSPLRVVVRLTRGRSREVTALLAPVSSPTPGVPVARDSVRLARRGVTAHHEEHTR